MPSLINRLIVRDLTSAFEGAEGLILVTYNGLTAVENETLRDKLAEKGCELRLVRNALAHLVLKQRGYELASDALVGNTAVAFGSAEAVIHAAKTLNSADTKKLKKVAVRAGVLEGRLLSPADVVQLGDVPDRPTLQAKILGCMSGPPRGIVTSMNAVPSALVRVLQARADQLAKAAPAAEAAPAA
ncbi:MAG: 50S ribosomal protein L10 [Planctomycetota bacterium]|nr:50S ribosomal protein L10 [Planctomycetota bacterium]